MRRRLSFRPLAPTAKHAKFTRVPERMRSRRSGKGAAGIGATCFPIGKCVRFLPCRDAVRDQEVRGFKSRRLGHAGAINFAPAYFFARRGDACPGHLPLPAFPPCRIREYLCTNHAFIHVLCRSRQAIRHTSIYYKYCLCRHIQFFMRNYKIFCRFFLTGSLKNAIM